VSDPEPTVRPARAGFRVPKIVVDLVFTFAIPVALLSPSLLGRDANGEGIGVSDLLGIVPTYVIAGLIPALYILADTLRTRRLNPLTSLAATSALVGGLLAFLRVDGVAFALKDSYGSIVVALVMGGSLLLGRPFFGVILPAFLDEGDPARRASLGRLLGAPAVARAVRLATLVLLLESCLLGSLNFAVNLSIVSERFGTKTFLAQIAQANTVMRPVSLVASLAAYGLAFYLLQRGVSQAFGPKARLFEDDLWDVLEQPQSARNP
jgi:hypothetical protein